MSPVPFIHSSAAPPSERRTEPALDTSPPTWGAKAPVPGPAASPLHAVSASDPHSSDRNRPNEDQNLNQSQGDSHKKGDTNPASLEALLSKRPGVQAFSPALAPAQNTGHTAAPPPSRALEILHAQAVRATACADLDAELLLIHAGTEEGATASTWMRQVLAGASLHSARYQDNVDERVLLLQPHLVFIHFDVPVLELATRLVEQLHTAHPGLPIVALGRMRNSQATLAALRAGVKEFLDLDDTGLAAQNTVRELMARAPSTNADTGKTAPLTALISARAGSGCSLLASHLALFLQQRLQQSPSHATAQAPTHDTAEAALDTLLIDLGYPASDCAMYLNCYGEFDFMQAVQNLRRFDRKLAASALARHTQGLRLLALPKQHTTNPISHTDTDLIVLRLRQYFRHVIADLGAVQPNQLGQRVALRASQIWVVCEQTVASVVASTQLLAQLAEQKVDHARIQLIVNRHDARLELDAEQIAKQLQLPLLAMVPERRVELAKATNQGALLQPSQQREPYVQELNRLTEHLVKLHSLQPALKANRGLSRFFQRHTSA